MTNPISAILPTLWSAAAAGTSDTSGTSGSNSTGSGSSGVDLGGGIDSNTFLQLLVAQIKNQDPLQPTDGVPFLNQLAPFSQLEQTIGMRKDIHALAPQAPAYNTGDNAGK